MIFTWLRDRRRRRLLARPFPPQWLDHLRRNVAHYDDLSEDEQAKLRDDLRIFIAEKYWEGCRGLLVTDEMRVTIAAQACLLVLALPHNYFSQVVSILIYPRAYRPVEEDPLGFSRPIDRGHPAEGEAHYRGPVILSWADVLKDGRHPERGQNVVYHEFAHQLDMLNGWVDGTPPLESPQQYRRWRDVMTAEYEDLVRASEHGRATLLDHYGATNEAEFFAVATECFFDKPVQLSHRHPGMYALLRDYFHQDPAARAARRSGAGESPHRV
jgi:Mlc titration factor MtfA (ptsG expression regulator)